MKMTFLAKAALVSAHLDLGARSPPKTGLDLHLNRPAHRSKAYSSSGAARRRSPTVSQITSRLCVRVSTVS